MLTLTYAIVSRINKLLEEKGMTMYKLSEESGVSYSTIKTIMQRKTNNIELRTVILLANGFGLTVSEFLDDSAFLVDNLDIY